jgi:polyisoprenyl-teichoic acid--peptidoglycan teichoic acid transferase
VKNSMNQQYNRPMARSPRRRKQNLDTTTRVLVIIFIVLGVILAFVGGRFVVNLIKGGSTNLPGVSDNSSNNNASVSAPGIPLQSVKGPAAAAWDGKSRVNILLLALDVSPRRQSEGQGSPLSDTMILVTIDPASRTVGAMSIRRDLWVKIPGFDYNKINAAYKLGEDYAVEGGGAQLAMDTVTELLGVPVDFYARVDFQAFEKIIDEIGGVTITLTQPMLLDWIGNGNKFSIEPGTYVMPGNYTLAYARTRDEAYGDGDFARGSRQMEVIMAIRDRVLNLNTLPTLIARAPAIYGEISSGVQTNMSLDQAVQLAYVVAQIPKENMHTYNMDDSVTTATFNFQGSYILQPIPDALRIMRDEMFAGSGGTISADTAADTSADTSAGISADAPVVAPQDNGVVAASGDPLPLAVQENARIQILNGSNTAGLADRTMTYLQSNGLTNIAIGNYDTTDSTQILVHTPVPNTLTYLAAVFGVPNARVFNQADPTNTFDITVVLGNDWAANNQIP